MKNKHKMKNGEYKHGKYLDKPYQSLEYYGLLFDYVLSIRWIYSLIIPLKNHSVRIKIWKKYGLFYHWPCSCEQIVTKMTEREARKYSMEMWTFMIKSSINSYRK